MVPVSKPFRLFAMFKDRLLLRFFVIEKYALWMTVAEISFNRNRTFTTPRNLLSAINTPKMRLRPGFGPKRIFGVFRAERTFVVTAMQMSFSPPAHRGS